MTRTELILSLIQIIEPKTERDAIIKAAAIQLMDPDDSQAKPAEPEQDKPKKKEKRPILLLPRSQGYLSSRKWATPTMTEK